MLSLTRSALCVMRYVRPMLLIRLFHGLLQQSACSFSGDTR